MHSSGSIVVFLALGGAVSGCGSSPSASTASDCTDGCWQPTPEDEAVATELCSLTEDCCVANAVRAVTDVEGCKASFLDAGLSRDPSVRSMCLAELRSLAALAPRCFPDLWNLAGACMRLVYEPSGPQRPGQACTQRADCEGAPGALTFCSADPSQQSPTGMICLRVTPGRAGDKPCLGAVTDSGAVFVAALYRPNRTTAPIATGAVCEARAGLYCGPDDDPEFWSCMPLREDGAACEHSTTCASRECLTDSGGEASTARPGTCTRRVPPGQPCLGFTPRTLCDDTGYCRFDTDGKGVCLPKLSDGAVCDSAEMCLGGTCDTTKHCSPREEPDSLAVAGFCSRP